MINEEGNEVKVIEYEKKGKNVIRIIDENGKINKNITSNTSMYP